jgi:hypothetical protein
LLYFGKENETVKMESRIPTHMVIIPLLRSRLKRNLAARRPDRDKINPARNTKAEMPIFPGNTNAEATMTPGKVSSRMKAGTYASRNIHG